jgi:Sulfotransferase family
VDVDRTDDALVGEIREWARAHPVVFVCGAARSGTTRVYSVFQCSPEFARASGRVTESGLFRSLARIDEYRRVRELFVFLGEPGPEQDELDRALALSGGWSEEERRRFRIQAFFFAAHRFGRMPRLAEKTPGHELHATELAACFPRARFVYVQRHPVDVLASIRGVYEREKARGQSEAAERAWGLGAATFAAVYRRSAEAFWRLREQRPDAVQRVPFEAFVADPEAVMRGAFAFVGAAFESAYLDPRGKGDRWGDWEPLLKEPVQPVAATWRERLRPDEVETVQSRLADVLREAGYEACEP